MVTRIAEIDKEYRSELVKADKGISGLSPKGLGYHALGGIPENLLEDKYSFLNRIVEKGNSIDSHTSMYFRLKDMSESKLVSRLRKMGFKVAKEPVYEPEKEKRIYAHGSVSPIPFCIEGVKGKKFISIVITKDKQSVDWRPFFEELYKMKSN